ncbi:uncharacterized protein EV420DRAFT_1702740 [Desarmillaria tabescens]|uniref:Uncharacterized protein n=1 Tax=Armillaria tabescens TaxID=1929756 RepID=A0AA39IZU7_ARMTA|nr:uncharacterized protein EV420DRAFT_1702740 [Desarmillaria tabescens]KAK0432204.1 hypothetical protein EV420DRAFT_1702740 [Desarmillaria tabescens]
MHPDPDDSSEIGQNEGDYTADGSPSVGHDLDASVSRDSGSVGYVNNDIADPQEAELAIEPETLDLSTLFNGLREHSPPKPDESLDPDEVPHEQSRPGEATTTLTTMEGVVAGEAGGMSLDLANLFAQLRDNTIFQDSFATGTNLQSETQLTTSLPLFTESSSMPQSPCNAMAIDNDALDDMPLPSSDDEMEDQDVYDEFLPEAFPNQRIRRTMYESLDRRTGVYVEQGLYINVTDDPVNPTVDFRGTAGVLSHSGKPYGTSGRSSAERPVAATVAGQMSYQELGRLDKILDSSLDNLHTLPCLDCPEKEQVDAAAATRSRVESLPCYVIYLTSPEWDSTGNLESGAASASVPASSSTGSRSKEVTVCQRALTPWIAVRSREEDWPRWDTMFPTMIDVLVTLRMKNWNSMYKRFAAVQVVVAILEKLGLVVHGWGCNNSLIPVQTWLLDRMSSRPARYLHVEWRTFQNWVSALWNDLELVYWHLVKRVTDNLPLSVDSGQVYDRLRVWYTLPLADAMTGVYTPTDQELLVLKDMTPYESWTALIAAQRVEARNASSGSGRGTVAP